MIDEDLLITFIAILAGLGLTDLIHSLHRLLRKRKEIKWHWIPIVHTFISFQTMIILWYDIKFELNSPLINTSLGFFLWLIPIILLLLIMLTVLPDKEPKPGFNLLEWYFDQRQYYFVLGTLFGISIGINRYIAFDSKSFVYVVLPFVYSALISTLIFTKNYYINASITIFMLCTSVLNFFLQNLGIV